MNSGDSWRVYDLMKGDGYEPWASIFLFGFILAVAFYLPVIIEKIDKEEVKGKKE